MLKDWIREFLSKRIYLKFCLPFALKKKANLLSYPSKLKFRKGHESDDKLSINHIIYSRSVNIGNML